MHNTEELKRQYQAAKSRSVKADSEMQNAKSALSASLVSDFDAEMKKRGIEKGTRVDVFDVNRGKREPMGEYFYDGAVVRVVYGLKARPSFSNIKKDGSAGLKHKTFWGDVEVVKV